MIEYLKFHLAKMLAEVGVVLLIVTLMCLPLFWLILKDKWKTWRCKHLSYRIVRADALCNQCNKNLGYYKNVESKHEPR